MKKGILLEGEYYRSRKIESLLSAAVVIGSIILAALFMIFCLCFCAFASSDSEICAAIYQAEGGSKTKYPYGIRSVNCETKEECKAICERTVRRSRARLAKNRRDDTHLIDELQKRYCPIGADNDPNGLNHHWEKNVIFYLAKGRSNNVKRSNGICRGKRGARCSRKG